MKKRRVISHLLSVSMLFVVLFSSIVSSGMPIQQVEIAKSKAEQKKKEDKKTDQTTVSELSITGIMPSHAFDFGHDAILIPAPRVIFLVAKETLSIITKPLFRISYFEKLFEHHIAINAP